VIEFKNSAIETLQLQVAKEHDFLITNRKMDIYGRCSKCKNRT